jgi:hypothetical protein
MIPAVKVREVRARTWSLAGLAVVLLLVPAGTAEAQQLDPRAYSPMPTGLNFVGVSPLYSSGGVVTDPTLPVTNVTAHVYAVPPYYGRSFGVLGRVASVTVSVPYAWAHAEGDVKDVHGSVDRSGLLDSQLRLGVLLLGCPALTPQQFAGRKPGATLGASVSVTAPLGQYDASKLINLGTNRWSFKPELGLSQPVRDWVFELYAGVTLFETNDAYYGGKSRSQDPLTSLQTHVVRNVTRTVWAAGDFTYYNGGVTRVAGQPPSQRQDNTRIGVTFAVPAGRNQSLKLAWAQGVSTRVGSSFQTISLGWQLRWF